MESRKWSPPASAPSQAPVVSSPDAPAQSPRSEWGILEYGVSFAYCMLFFGVIAGLVRSRFPIDLGLFFFFTKEELIARVLYKTGIRLVPDSLGATFVNAFVWLTGVSILFAQWKNSTPAWLSSWFPPNAPWSFIAGAALGCVVLTTISKVVIGKVLPWIGIEIARDSLARTMIQGLVLLALILLAFLLSTPVVSDWLRVH